MQKFTCRSFDQNVWRNALYRVGTIERHETWSTMYVAREYISTTYLPKMLRDMIALSACFCTQKLCNSRREIAVAHPVSKSRQTAESPSSSRVTGTGAASINTVARFDDDSNCRILGDFGRHGKNKLDPRKIILSGKWSYF